MKRDEAVKIREMIEKASVSLDDSDASNAPELFPRMKYNGELIQYKTRINWNGVVKRAKVDLWDTEANNPENAPALWDDIEYIAGVRKIPVTDSGIFEATLAFSAGEEGYSTVDDTVYISNVNGNVYTPQLVPTNWTKKEETA